MVEMYDNKDLKADKTYLVTLGGQQGFGTGHSGPDINMPKTVR